MFVLAYFPSAPSTFLPSSTDEQHWRCEDDREEKDDQVKESSGCSKWLDDESVDNIAHFEEGAHDEGATVELLVILFDWRGKAFSFASWSLIGLQ